MNALRRILYVDDDAGLRRLVQRALERRNFVVETAASVDEGMAVLARGEIELVAVDHHMPGKDGLAMLAEISALDDPPPVVFVTGTDDTRVAVEAMTSGAADFVIKTVGESFFDMLAGRLRQAYLRVSLERDKRAAEAKLREANERLEMLLREVHHRVSNSLQMVSSFVSMQAAQTDDPAASEALAATQSRIQAISQVHRRLYTRSDVAAIDLDEYLSTLVEDLQGSLPQGNGVMLALDAEPVDVSPDQAVSVGVIVNELVGNAAKYAFGAGKGGRIDIALAREADGGFSVSVSDDGDGFAADEPAKGTGLGMRIVNAVARSLGTSVARVDRAHGSCHRLVVAG